MCCDALIEPLQPWQQGQDFTAAATASELSVQTHNAARVNNTKKTIFQHLLLFESLSYRNLVLHDDACERFMTEKSETWEATQISPTNFWIKGGVWLFLHQTSYNWKHFYYEHRSAAKYPSQGLFMQWNKGRLWENMTLQHYFIY